MQYRYKRALFGQQNGTVSVYHANPPQGLIASPFLVEKVEVSSPTITATPTGKVLLDSYHVLDLLFQHFDSDVQLVEGDRSFSVTFSSLEKAEHYFESTVVC